MVKWSVDDIYDIKKDESVCNSCYSPILWVHVIWSKQLFIVICLVFLLLRFHWGHSTTTWIKFYPILTTYSLEWKIVVILPNTVQIAPMVQVWSNTEWGKILSAREQCSNTELRLRIYYLRQRTQKAAIVWLLELALLRMTRAPLCNGFI